MDMNPEEMKHFLESALGPEEAEFVMNVIGDGVEIFNVIGLGEPESNETVQERIQRETWFDMYPVTWGAEKREGGCPNCKSDDCLNAHVYFPSHVN